MQATLASFKGTYTYQSVILQEYSVEENAKSQQVGFCNVAVAIGYSCFENYTFNILAGSLVSKGEGHITSGTYAYTNAPNSYECNPNINPATPCPAVVPA